MSAAAAPVIVTDGLTKRYGDRVAVDHLDLQVMGGEVFGLLGPNGAGKTTTVLMLLGLSEPSEGEARILDLDPVRQPLAVKRRVGYLPDAVGFYPQLTGRENLRYTTRLNGIPRELAEERIDDVLQQVGLSDAGDRPCEHYSRGMLQRLGIADALVKDPQILILDEPTIAIDPRGVEELLTLIRQLREERGVTVLLSSHLLHQVQAVCDRVGIFVAGRMVAVGTVAELAERLAGGHHTVEVGVAADPGRAREVLQRSLDVEVEPEGQLLVVTADRDVREPVSRLLADAGLTVTHLRLRADELDDIYARYFREHEVTGDGGGGR